MQPWQGHVVLGATLAKLTETVREVALTDNGKMGHEREYKYYPDEFFEPFLARRRVVGFGLYDLIGIGKGDSQRMRERSDEPVGRPWGNTVSGVVFVALVHCHGSGAAAPPAARARWNIVKVSRTTAKV